MVAGSRARPPHCNGDRTLAGLSCGLSDATTLADRRFDRCVRRLTSSSFCRSSRTISCPRKFHIFGRFSIRTTAGELAATLGANPHTTSKRLKRVRIKAQSIIKSLDNRVPSSET